MQSHTQKEELPSHLGHLHFVRLSRVTIKKAHTAHRSEHTFAWYPRPKFYQVSCTHQLTFLLRIPPQDRALLRRDQCSHTNMGRPRQTLKYDDDSSAAQSLRLRLRPSRRRCICNKNERAGVQVDKVTC